MTGNRMKNRNYDIAELRRLDVAHHLPAQQNHKLMQERARQRGVKLPNMPAHPMHRGMQGQGRNTMPSRKGGGRPGR